MLARIYDRTIATRLGLAYALFLLPVAFLLYLIISDKEVLTAAARQEVMGVHAIASLTAVQQDVVRDTGKDGLAGLADKVAQLDLSLDGALDPSVLSQAVAQLRKPGLTAADASGIVVALIGKVADASGLTLDTDLDSFYVMDAVTGKLPALVHELFGIVALAGPGAGQDVSPPSRETEFVIREARTTPLLEGLGGSLETAFKANTQGKTRMALEAVSATAHEQTVQAIARLKSLSQGDARSPARAQEIFRPALGELGKLREAGLNELQRLLEVRMAGFRWQLLTSLAIALGLFSIAIAYVLVAIQYGTARPIRQMTIAMNRLASGDLAVPILGVGRKDEIGQMAGTMQVFRDNMIETGRLRDEQEQQKAHAEAERKQMLAGLADSFEAEVKDVAHAVAMQATQMQASAHLMTQTAQQATQQATAVAAAVEEASVSVQTVASAADELSASILEIGRQVEQSSKIASQAATDAERTNSEVEGLSRLAHRIGEMVQLVEGIAAQTNLLALNATIEAARAGDAGKGFAVVAAEVKSLANQTAKTTDEIKTQITEIQGATSHTVDAIHLIGETIRRMNEIATSIASSVEEQSAATQEIARNVQRAAQGTGEIATNIGGVSRAANDTGVAATQVLSATEELSKQSETLRHDVDNFIASVRAA